MKLVRHRWVPRDIIGGNLALDLVSTVSGWEDNPEDWIPEAGSFLDWARMSGLLNAHEKSEAARWAAASPPAAERVLASLKDCVLLCGILSIVWNTASPPSRAISA